MVPYTATPPLDAVDILLALWQHGNENIKQEVQTVLHNLCFHQPIKSLLVDKGNALMHPLFSSPTANTALLIHPPQSAALFIPLSPTNAALFIPLSPTSAALFIPLSPTSAALFIPLSPTSAALFILHRVACSSVRRKHNK